MYHIPIDASPAQISKLRRGQPVRIKHGTGFNLLVHPETYQRVSRAFRAGKGTEIALSPPELQANAQSSSGVPVAIQNPEHPQAGTGEVAPTVAGSGIFGQTGDKYLKKAGIRNMAYKAGDYIKPAVKAGGAYGLNAMGAALATVQPELAPFIPAGSAAASMALNDYLDHPSRYQGHSGLKGHRANSLPAQSAQAQLSQDMNNQLGTNFDYMRQAGLSNAVAHQMSSDMNASSVGQRYMGGDGLHGRHHMRQHSIVGRGGGMIQSSAYVPPAMESQPFSANFQFQHFFPPQFQHMIHGNGLY